MGRLCWTDSGGAEQFKDLHYQPLYPARPQEGRLQNVDDYVPISQPPPLEQDPVFLLFQTGDDEVRACYAPLADLEASLASPDAPGAWHPNVAGPVTAAIQNWADQRTPQGYVDYTRGHTSLGTPVEIGGELSPRPSRFCVCCASTITSSSPGRPLPARPALSEVQRGFIQRFGSRRSTPPPSPSPPRPLVRPGIGYPVPPVQSVSRFRLSSTRTPSTATSSAASHPNPRPPTARRAGSSPSSKAPS